MECDTEIFQVETDRQRERCSGDIETIAMGRMECDTERFQVERDRQRDRCSGDIETSRCGAGEIYRKILG